MNDIVLTQLDIDEVLRYLGCPPDQADTATRRLAGDCAQEMLQLIRPRWTYRTESICAEHDGVRLDCGLLLPGEDIRRHLQGCEQITLFAVTLSAAVDLAIRRAESRDLARALCLDCCATTAVEQVCDRIEKELWAAYPDWSFTSRFSPGYGDLPLSLQERLLELLDAPRRIGLCANDHHILTPRKSVTALMGLTRKEIAAAPRRCEDCKAAAGCQYRKAGGHCGLS